MSLCMQSPKAHDLPRTDQAPERPAGLTIRLLVLVFFGADLWRFYHVTFD